MPTPPPTARPFTRYGCVTVAAFGVLSFACGGWLALRPGAVTDVLGGECDAEAATASGIDPLCGPSQWMVPAFAVLDGKEPRTTTFVGLTAMCADRASEPVSALPFMDQADAVSLQLPEGYTVSSASLRVTYDLDLWAGAGAASPAPGCDDVSQFTTVQQAAHVEEHTVATSSLPAFLQATNLTFEQFDNTEPTADPDDPSGAQRASCARAWTQTLRDGYPSATVLQLDLKEEADPPRARASLTEHRTAFDARLDKDATMSACARRYWRGAARKAVARRGADATEETRVSLDMRAWTLTISIATPDGGTITRTVDGYSVIGN